MPGSELTIATDLGVPRSTARGVARGIADTGGFLHLSPSRFHAWRRSQILCALDDRSSCPGRAPHRLTGGEIHAIKDMVTAPEYRHVPTGTLAVLAPRSV
jgi:hypothetical protein